MLDSSQTILLLVIIVLTILFLVLGVQLFLILRDFRKTLAKANNVLDDVSAVSSLADGLKAIGTIFGVGRKLLKGVSENKVKKISKEISKRVNGEEKFSFKKPIRRFFRGTKPL